MQGKGLEQKQQGKELVIDLQLSRRVFILLALGLALVALLGYLTWGQRQAAAASPQAPAAGTTGLRRFYLTKSNFYPDQALTACAGGYHMASLWEILEPSNLEYDTTLGKTTADSGQGPPIGDDTVGWVRTGYITYDDSTAGQANCNVWSTRDHDSRGTVVNLVLQWTSGTEDVHVWDVDWLECDYAVPAWCVED